MTPAPPAELISEARLRSRVAELAAAISRDFAGRDDLVLVGVLKGAFIFLSDLTRALTIPCRIDFLATSHYGAGGTTAAGKVTLLQDARLPLRGCPVILVEDILDTGHTLVFLLEHLRSLGADPVRTCIMLRKPERVEVAISPDYLGFDVPDLWLVGYGLDCGERWRTLPYVGILPEGLT